MHFCYLFLLTIANSIWQSGILLLQYVAISKSIKNIHPLQKRNLLYSFLLAQICLSALTFICLKYDIGLSKAIVLNSNTVNNFIQENELLLFVAYIGFVFIKIGLIGFQWSKFYFTYKKYVEKPKATLRLFAKTQAEQLGIKRNIDIWYSTAISTPITFGFLKPIILLPFSLCTQMQQYEVEAIILHELAHIKNKDYLLNWLLVIVEILFVFNPFIKIIIEKIELEREKNCDTQVINFKYDSISYAESLLLIARNANNLKSFQISAVKSTSQLYERIQFFCLPKNLQFKKINSGIYGLFIMPILLVLCLPSIQKNKMNALNTVSNINFIHKSPKLQLAHTAIEIEPSIIHLNGIKENEINFEKTEELSREIEDTILPYELLENNFVQFASFIDTLQNSKEFIYNIENAEGKITRTFEMKFVNGKWILIPQYLILQKYNDSNRLRIDSIYNGLDSLIQ